MTPIDKARQRLENKVPHEFILNDFMQNFCEGKVPSQKEIKDAGLMLADDLGVAWPFREDFTFYPSKQIISDNQVLQGDCRDILPLLAPNRPKGIITDFPYGIAFQSNMRKASPTFNKILNDEEPFLDMWIRHCYRILQDQGFFITFYRWDVQEPLFAEIQAAGFKIKNQLIWVKGTYGMGDLEGGFGEGHECAVFAVKGRYTFPNGRPSNILKSPGGSSTSGTLVHPNEKPIPLIRSLVRDLTVKGDLIVEPFSGSGSTAAACVEEGRRVIAMELDDRIVPAIGCNYIEYGNKRIQEFSKKNNSLF